MLKILFRSVVFGLVPCVLVSYLLAPCVATADGFCIKLNVAKGKLTKTTTSGTTCPTKQVFIPIVAGPAGQNGAVGATGPTGAAGSARGYGFVNSDGNLNTSLSSLNVSARKVDVGVYCISADGIDPATVMPVVSADQDTGSGSYHLAQIKTLYGSIFGCNSSEWSVATAKLSGATQSFTDAGFSFLIP